MRFGIEEKKVTVLRLHQEGHSVSGIVSLIGTTSDYVFRIINDYELDGNQAVPKSN